MTPRFPRMGSAQLIHILEKNGFIEKRQTGSHRIFFHPEKRKTTPVPVGKKDLPLGTVRTILKQAGIKMEHQ